MPGRLHVLAVRSQHDVLPFAFVQERAERKRGKKEMEIGELIKNCQPRVVCRSSLASSDPPPVLLVCSCCAGPCTQTGRRWRT